MSVTTNQAIPIGSRRELFVDYHLIEQMTGTELRLHHPQPAGVALRFDQPWEGPGSAYCTIIQDGDRYRLDIFSMQML